MELTTRPSRKFKEKDLVLSLRRRRAARKHEKHKAKVEAKKKAEDEITKIVEDLSRTYGYALIGCLFNIIYVLCLSSLPLTKWVGDGTASEGEGAVPGVDKWAWGLGYWGIFALVIAGSCTFTISQGSPFPLPGNEIECWDCALPCFFGMLLSGFTTFGITYHLPLSQGVSPEFYHLDMLPFILNFTLGVVLTRMLMRAYYDWMQQGRKDRSPPAASKLRNGNKMLTGKLKNRDAQEQPAAGRDGKRKENEASKKSGIWKMFINSLNTILIVFMAAGCESLSNSAQAEAFCTMLLPLPQNQNQTKR